MAPPFRATFSAPDMVALTRALIDTTHHARGTPTEMRRKLAKVLPAPDWREQMLAADADGLAVSWGATRIARNAGADAAAFPDIGLDPREVLDAVASLPFELAVMPDVAEWGELDYHAPALGADHALLGWGVIFKGDGHERSMVSRRWIEAGPWRVLHGPHDTTLVQFHDLDVDAATAVAQARAGHQWLVAGFLRPKHRYRHDIEGIYTDEDHLLRVVVNDRPVDDVELVDACAARRDRADDPARPLANIAYVFVDPAAAKARLDALWLRALECRAIVDGAEVRLDERHEVVVPRPSWV